MPDEAQLESILVSPRAKESKAAPEIVPQVLTDYVDSLLIATKLRTSAPAKQYTPEGSEFEVTGTTDGVSNKQIYGAMGELARETQAFVAKYSRQGLDQKTSFTELEEQLLGKLFARSLACLAVSGEAVADFEGGKIDEKVFQYTQKEPIAYILPLYKAILLGGSEKRSTTSIPFDEKTLQRGEALVQKVGRNFSWGRVEVPTERKIGLTEKINLLEGFMRGIDLGYVYEMLRLEYRHFQPQERDDALKRLEGTEESLLGRGLIMAGLEWLIELEAAGSKRYEEVRAFLNAAVEELTSDSEAAMRVKTVFNQKMEELRDNFDADDFKRYVGSKLGASGVEMYMSDLANSAYKLTEWWTEEK